MLWTLLVIGMTLAYLRRIGTPAVFLDATAVVVLAAVVGGGLGWCWGRTSDAVYWSLVITVAAFLSVASRRAYGPMYQFAWSAVGITTGACCGLLPHGRWVWRILTGASVAGATMLLFLFTFPVRNIETYFDVACAPIVGALVGLLIEIILWLESHNKIPRYITASWLLCAVILGNLI